MATSQRDIQGTTMTRSRPKEILFSELPLELKKQFLTHLGKNNVDFSKYDQKYMQALVRIVEKDDGSKELATSTVGRSRSGSKTRTLKQQQLYDDMMHKNHGLRFNKYHGGCVYGDWEKKRIENNSKLDDALK